MSTEQQLLREFLWQNYPEYQFTHINTKRFKYESLGPVFEILENSSLFKLKVAGKSFEERDIYQVSWGSGPVNILLWSQMHGDESTATRAFLDIISFFQMSDEMNSVREKIMKELTIHWIPVLNPDGMQRYQRRTAQEIDLNRDAVRVQTPESAILRTAREETGAVFGFNLHDQKIYYGAGFSDKPATISFLAPPYNYENEVNEVRGNAMKLIVEMNDLIQEKIPGMVARYDDEYNPRAFGDNIQKWGTSTILVESGGYPNDPEKEFVRKLNMYLLINAMHAIATKGFEQADIKKYYQIPENKETFYDLIVRNAAVQKGNRQFKADIGIKREEIGYNKEKGYYLSSIIEEIGDLSMFHAYQEVDVNGMECLPGKIYPYEFKTHKELSEFDLSKILDGGYTHVVVRDAMELEQFTRMPINILLPDQIFEPDIGHEKNADLIIKDGQAVRYVVLNGFLYDTSLKDTAVITNGRVNS